MRKSSRGALGACAEANGLKAYDLVQGYGGDIEKDDRVIVRLCPRA